jgi:hypothetical protein
VAITIYESHKSRNLKEGPDGQTVPVNYIVTGTTDPEAVRQVVLLDTSPTMFGLIRKEVSLDYQGGELWYVEVGYAPGDPSEAIGAEGGTGGEGGPPGGEGGEGGPGGGGAPPAAPGPDDPMPNGFSFSTGGGTAHVLLSKETRGKYKAGGGVAPDNKQAIGLTNEGVEGTDIPVAAPEFTIPRKRRTITRSYYNTLCALTGKTNNAEFWGFKRGELMYMGCEGSVESSTSGALLNHKFQYREDQPAGDPRNDITPDLTLTAGKRGFEFVWCRYEDQVRDGKLYPTPVAAYVERVSDEGDFSQLQLG